MLSIGLMSGTSMDGIDAALIETDGISHIKEINQLFIPYSHEFKIILKAAEYSVRKCAGNLHATQTYYPQGIVEYLKNELKIIAVDKTFHDLIAYMHSGTCPPACITFDEVIHHSTHLHEVIVKQLLKESGYTANQIDVIGYHGQTLFHHPAAKITIQIGNGQWLADQTKMAVIHHFRQKDVSLGGEGAPLAPIYHHALAVRDKKIPAAVINCGGIANMTLIRSANELDLIGFDTGPGNCLVDRFVKERTHGQENMDEGGQYGRAGKCDAVILNLLHEKCIPSYGKNYFSSSPPKSLDSGDLVLIPELSRLSLEDGCRTLETFTAITIVNSLDALSGNLPTHFILAGGGWKNPIIRSELESRLQTKLHHKAIVQGADQVGWNSQALEAQLFAYLAVRSLLKKPITFPGTTRIATPLLGGQAYFPSKECK